MTSLRNTALGRATPSVESQDTGSVFDGVGGITRNGSSSILRDNNNNNNNTEYGGNRSGCGAGGSVLEFVYKAAIKPDHDGVYRTGHPEADQVTKQRQKEQMKA